MKLKLKLLKNKLDPLPPPNPETSIKFTELEDALVKHKSAAYTLDAWGNPEPVEVDTTAPTAASILKEKGEKETREQRKIAEAVGIFDEYDSEVITPQMTELTVSDDPSHPQVISDKKLAEYSQEGKREGLSYTEKLTAARWAAREKDIVGE